MNGQEDFDSWLTKKFGENNGTKSSYLKALEMVSEKLNQNIFDIKNLNEINELYLELKREQRNVNGKFYNYEAPSYAINGFYSAAVKNYMEFFESYNSEKMEKQ